MRRVFSLFLCIFLLCGCVPVKKTNIVKESDDSKIYGVWITYSELNSMLAGDFKSEFSKCVSTLKKHSITDIFVHVRPFCDSLYKSNYFPQNELSKSLDFDVLSYIIEKSHEENIKVHAWINPYRVKTSDENLETLPENSPVKNLEINTDYVIFNGIYLLPSSDKAKRLITDGIREVCNNYNIDGIHIDDYFYPTKEESFDKTIFENYKNSSENPLTLKQFRTSNVNALISSIYTAIKFIDKNILFSVSPCASIDKNINDYFADIKTWCKNDCVDIIIPQLYFGFNYPDKEYRFDKLFEKWKNYLGKTDVKIVIGLALYKINTESQPDNIEWKNGKEIIEKQIEICSNDKKISGFSLFSYSYFDKLT